MSGKRAEVSRRHVIRGAAGASAVAIASVGSTEEAQAYVPGGDEMRARYRESEHVKAFYRTNGYETKSKK